MNTPDPFLQLVPNRVEAALRRVNACVWLDRKPLIVDGAAPTKEHRPLDEARTSTLSLVPASSAWGRLFDQRWFRLQHDAKSSKGVHYLEWVDQGEATLHVDGVPYYGFDVAHRRVALPARIRELWVEAYCCQSAIWHPQATGISPKGSVFSGAFLVRRDDLAWNTQQDLQCLFDLMMHLRGQQPPTPPRELSRFGQQPSVDQATLVYRHLLRRLAGAIDAFDTGGLEALRAVLGKIYREFHDPKSIVRATLTGHAHIDLVWLWPERMGEAKAVHTFATMNRLMSLYPEFRFAYSQPASYRAVERRAPALATAVSQRIASGQWQASGALDVESDTLLPCGEALARSFTLGQAEFARLRGEPSRLLWLPDVFGYSGCLPQLMRLAGVEWFFTTKLTWSAINRFPYSSFVWRGTDGSEVVAHVTQNVGYNNQLTLPELQANACGHTQSDVHAEFLHPTGFGDGGGGATEEMCERARRLNALAGTPALAWDQPEAFFARLARKKKHLPVYQGECYLEYHRGTFTTHGGLKAAFRGLECALQIREAVAVARGTTPDLTAPWRRLVFSQFHDYIPGSSIAEVYAEGVPELQRIASEQIGAARTELGEGKGGWQVFNPLPQPWRGWVQVPHLRRRLWCELPPLGSVPLAVEAKPPGKVSLRQRTLRNERVLAEIGRNGWLHRLVVDGRELALLGPGVRAVLYPDFPANYDAWDIDRAALALGVPVSDRPHFKIETNDSDRVVLAVSRALGKASTLTVRYSLNAGDFVLRMEAHVDWHEKHTLLKLHFPTAYRGLNARFGAPFGSVLRCQQPGASTTEAQWEVAGSRWAAVSSDGEIEGLALITESKYGFLARDGDLSVSLLRGAQVTGSGGDRYAPVPGINREDSGAARHTDQGRHVIKFAIGSYRLTAPLPEQPAALAESLFSCPLLYQGEEHTAGLQNIENADTLVPAWAQPLTPGSWLLRLHEVSGQRGIAKLGLIAGWRAVRCNLDGTEKDRIPPLNLHEVSYKPYEIVSLKISRER